MTDNLSPVLAGAVEQDSVAVLVGGIVFLAAGLLVPQRIRAIWTNQAGYHPDQSPHGWPLGGPLWRGWVRMTPAALVSAVLLGGFSVASYLGLAGITWALLAGWGSSVLVMVLVVVLNWPKAAVAPHLRHQPGLLRETLLGASPDPTTPPANLWSEP